jgi:DNA polymerase-4
VTALNIIEKQEAVKQLNLFSYEEDAKQEPLLKTVEQLKQKFGDLAIQRGVDLMAGKPYDDWRKKQP